MYEVVRPEALLVVLVGSVLVILAVRAIRRRPTSDLRSRKRKHGGQLRKNIERMRKDAPFKKK